MQFEKNLALTRKKRGMSQEELAFAIGVSRQTIYTWEAGISYPNILMLKKLAEVFAVKTDDLLNGFAVTRLPAAFHSLRFTFLKPHDGEIYYNELPNWFVQLEPDAEVCWALYDQAKDGYTRDYAYQVAVTGKAMVHEKDCLEIEVKEYKPDFSFSRSYNQFISVTEEGVAWVGQCAVRDGKKSLQTYKDQSFLDDWGYNGKFLPTKMRFDQAEDGILEFDDEKRRAILLSYFDPNGSDDPKRSYFEVILNQDSESLAWRRYTKAADKNGEPSGETLQVDDCLYDMDYICLTSRIL